MEKTANFELNQWEKTDRIQMEDFNADNAKLEAALSKCGNCRVVTGTYVGTGEKGKTSPTSLTFDAQPLAVFISQSNCQLMHLRNSTTSSLLVNGSVNAVAVTFSGNTVSWYNEAYASYQMNSEGYTYFYFALLQADE